jgi:hypothetical protein
VQHRVIDVATEGILNSREIHPVAVRRQLNSIRNAARIVDVPTLPVASRAFLWSFGMLVANSNPATGLVRDRADFPSDDFDAASGGHVAATVVAAWPLGFITHAAAAYITDRTTSGLLALPQMLSVLPHFVTDCAPPPCRSSSAERRHACRTSNR